MLQDKWHVFFAHFLVPLTVALFHQAGLSFFCWLELCSAIHIVRMVSFNIIFLTVEINKRKPRCVKDIAGCVARVE